MEGITKWRQVNNYKMLKKSILLVLRLAWPATTSRSPGFAGLCVSDLYWTFLDFNSYYAFQYYT